MLIAACLTNIHFTNGHASFEAERRGEGLGGGLKI